MNEVIILFGVIALFFYGWISHRILIGEFFLGCVFALFWETIFCSHFTYSGSSWTIWLWNDIPLFMILAWATFLTVSLLVSNHLSRVLGFSGLKIMFLDAIVIMVLGSSAEYVGLNLTNGWEYLQTLDYALGIPINALIGYVIIGVLYMTFMRKWQSSFDLKVR